MVKGGAAKGELVIAIFELANCFRHGWGIAKDPVAAKQVGPLARTYHENSYNVLGNSGIQDCDERFLEVIPDRLVKRECRVYLRAVL